MKVLIAGGGIAGLTLAHGLLREGSSASCSSASRSRPGATGYLLNLDAEGDGGLLCLPAAGRLYELFTARLAARPPSQPRRLGRRRPAGSELTTMPHIGAAATGEPPPHHIDRRDVPRDPASPDSTTSSHHGAQVAGFDVRGGSRRAALVDGRSHRGRRPRRRGRRRIAGPPPAHATGADHSRAGRRARTVRPLAADRRGRGRAAADDLGCRLCVRERRPGTMLGVGHLAPRQPVRAAAAELGLAEPSTTGPVRDAQRGASPRGRGAAALRNGTPTRRAPCTTTMEPAVAGLASGDPGTGRPNRADDAVLPPVPATRSDRRPGRRRV